MRFILYDGDTKEIGRAELELSGEPPAVVLWNDRAFVLFTRAGYTYFYRQQTVIEIPVKELRK